MFIKSLLNLNTLNNLTGIANKKSIAIPSSTTTQGIQAVKFLHTKSGMAFDKEYCDLIVVRQKNTIKL